jgi:hypothetical protein
VHGIHDEVRVLHAIAFFPAPLDVVFHPLDVKAQPHEGLRENIVYAHVKCRIYADSAPISRDVGVQQGEKLDV